MSDTTTRRTILAGTASLLAAPALIGGVSLEETVWPILKYLGLLFLCLLLIAFVPEISTALPRGLGH